MQPGSAASNCIVYLMPKRYRASILFWISMQARDCASLASPIHTGGHACGSAAQYARIRQSGGSKQRVMQNIARIGSVDFEFALYKVVCLPAKCGNRRSKPSRRATAGTRPAGPMPKKGAAPVVPASGQLGALGVEIITSSRSTRPGQEQVDLATTATIVTPTLTTWTPPRLD